MSSIHTQAIQGILLIDDGQPIYCESCEYAKTTRKNIKKEHEALPAKEFGEEVHSNLWTSPQQSLRGREYYITFTGKYSCFTITHLPKAKSEVLQAYKDFTAWALTQHSVKVKHFHSDRGSEYMGDNFTKYLNQQGTEWHATTHDTPQHNGVAESLN